MTPSVVFGEEHVDPGPSFKIAGPGPLQRTDQGPAFGHIRLRIDMPDPRIKSLVLDPPDATPGGHTPVKEIFGPGALVGKFSVLLLAVPPVSGCRGSVSQAGARSVWRSVFGVDVDRIHSLMISQTYVHALCLYKFSSSFVSVSFLPRNSAFAFKVFPIAFKRPSS